MPSVPVLRLTAVQPALLKKIPLPLFYGVAWLATSATGSPTAALQQAAISAFVVWLCLTVRVISSKGSILRAFDLTTNPLRQKCFVSGLLLALAQLCERGAGRGNSVWWSKALVPWMVILAKRIQSGNTQNPGTVVEDGIYVTLPESSNSLWFLLLGSFSSLVVFANAFMSTTETALALSAALCGSLGWTYFELAVKYQQHSVDSPTSPSEKQRVPLPSIVDRHDGVLEPCMREISIYLAAATGFAALAFEPFPAQGLAFSLRFMMTVIFCTIKFSLAFVMIVQDGTLRLSVYSLGTVLLAALWAKPSLDGLTFAPLAAFALNNFMNGRTAWPGSMFQRGLMRRHILLGLVLLCAGSLTIQSRHMTFSNMSNLPISLQNLRIMYHKDHGAMHAEMGPWHPVLRLVGSAEIELDTLLERQSQTLGEAVKEYRKRYRVPPPPSFDGWFHFARERKTQLIDEFNVIHNALLPFWALKPSVIRERVREAIGDEDNALIVMRIRDGEVVRLRGGLPWQQESLRGMMQSFISLLPDMDLAFNAHDEPRIVVPHEDLSRMMSQADSESIRKAAQNEDSRNSFSKRPEDMNDGRRIKEYRFSRFNEYAHQNTWVPSRLSCPSGSPARDFNENPRDKNDTYLTYPLGFISDQSAFSDICNSPSMKGKHGFFDRPNAFNVAHELIPVFSESKISSFQDVIFPSMWHWYGKLFTNSTWDMHLNNTPNYDESYDPDWNEKNNTLWWRGSTTGGYSREGSWRKQHRQRIVRNLNRLEGGTTFRNGGSDSYTHWELETVRKRQYDHLIDVKLSGVGQCDPSDCQEQEEFFDIAPFADMQSTWQNKHVLDMDGNAFSARFYALMRSRSLVYKMAVFREWHDEWLIPWLHYIPLSLNGQEHLEVVRFFAEDEQGTVLAERLAKNKREWAQKVLRREDMETWFFRLLLEYGRLIQDDREEIGFAG